MGSRPRVAGSRSRRPPAGGDLRAPQRQRLFHAALPGASADNDGWLARKYAVVDRYGCSSLRVGEQFRVAGKSFDTDSRLDPGEYAAHGGAFPILLRGTGCIGTVAVSGLPQRDDHRLVVEALEQLLYGAAG
ncbi:heme-degrading domain-containing protein [Nocardioides endophyticus]|uniref:heme-degrading domain-containing protein n=1 Tax=Nocardioides endophyticus TaxID=1353775 RepID=UPI0031E71352